MAKTSNHFYFDGFEAPKTTQVPDVIFDELAPQLTEAELRVLLYVVRRTFGFKKDSDAISLSQMTNGITRRDGTVLDRGTGMSRRGVMIGCSGLIEKGIILVEKRQAEQGDSDINVYRLHFKSEFAGVGNVVPYGREPNTPPVGNEVAPQVTGLQEAVGQQTESEEYSNTLLKPDITISKFRKGEPKNFEAEALEPTTNPASDSPTRDGFQPLAALVSDHPLQTHAGAAIRRAESLDKAPVQSGVAAETIPAITTPGQAAFEAQRSAPARSSLPAAQLGKPGYAEDRALVLAYLRDYAAEFHDLAPLKSSVTRALHLLQRSGLSQERWTGKLYEARNLTKEQAAAIGYQGRGKPRAGTTAAGLNKMPYFFSVLECVLGLHDHPAGQHPLPLSPEEFKQQSRGARPGKIPSRPQQTLAEQGSDAARPSLAGRYARLVEH